MNALEEPLLPSGRSSPASDSNASPDADQTRSSGSVLDQEISLDDDVLNQIRSILINAGITATMINLPMDSVKGPAPGTPGTSIVSADDNVDIEQDAGKRPSWLKKKMNDSAERRQTFMHDKTSEYTIAEDVYNMFFLSKNFSLPFWYTILTACNKLTLYGIVLYWIYRPGGFRDTQNDRGEAPPIVRVTQLLLIPCAVGITEELMITMDVLSKTSWVKLEDHPQATRLKFWIANTLRALDGVFWLLIITSLMLYAVDILEMFLNFAALQFLQCIDNSAYEMAKGGYLTSAFEQLATQVSETTLPTKRATWREYSDTIILFTLLSLMIMAWALVNFADPNRTHK